MWRSPPPATSMRKGRRGHRARREWVAESANQGPPLCALRGLCVSTSPSFLRAAVLAGGLPFAPSPTDIDPMERQAPVPPADEIDLYVRTYTSLLRSTGDVDVRAFEEAHAFSASSLHEGALSADIDVSAFAYAAGRLPLDMPRTRRIVLGQSHELFEAAGFLFREWGVVKARGRRRPMRWNGSGTLGVVIASPSDIDDLAPVVTAYQIEGNK